jgi:hypothetical protein
MPTEAWLSKSVFSVAVKVLNPRFMTNQELEEAMLESYEEDPETAEEDALEDELA